MDKPEEPMVTPQMQSALRAAKYAAARKDMDEKKNGKKGEGRKKGGAIKKRCSKLQLLARCGKKRSKDEDAAVKSADLPASSHDTPYFSDGHNWGEEWNDEGFNDEAWADWENETDTIA